ncbi:MAG: peptidoglycan-binding protein [Actinobacteria bacterium]|nr:peptidoglycan-binding protein [Actinomycetota bacterium]
MIKSLSSPAWLANSARCSGILMLAAMLIATSGTVLAVSRSQSATTSHTSAALSRVSDRPPPPVAEPMLAANQMTPVPGAEVASSPPSTEPSPSTTLAPIPATVAAAGIPQGTALLGRGALPVGKGMWLYLPDRVEGGDVDALVARATTVGLTHVYVRTGSSRSGFYAAPYLDQLLGKAHAAGIRVYGWDFPYLEDVKADVDRALAAMSYTTPDGHRIDGFAPDIETPSEGTNLNAETAGAYSEQLRAAVGAGYPLIAVVPRPSSYMKVVYPYQAIVPHYDAVAPMVYWLNRQPDTDAGPAVAYFRDLFGKPVIPVGQAYDGGPEGGRPGPPPPDEISRFLAASEEAGAVGASFWSWQHADQLIWDAIQAAPQFLWEAKPPAELRPGQIRSLQASLAQLGWTVAVTGTWDDATTASVSAVQQAHGITVTGTLDPATIAALLMPMAPPLP